MILSATWLGTSTSENVSAMSMAPISRLSIRHRPTIAPTRSVGRTPELRPTPMW